jgi:hypothetical protein
MRQQNVGACADYVQVRQSIFLLFWPGKVRKQASWYCQYCLITGSLTLVKKFIGSVVDTGEQFFAGINDTRDH